MVPSVLGYTVKDAEKLTGVHDIFDIIVEETVFSDDIPAGVIMRQDPIEGTEKKSGLHINVIVSGGPATGIMPGVIGQESRQAEKVILRDMITELNLTLVTESEYSDEYNKGYVIDSRPAADTVINKGDTITLIISKGPQKTVVPNFVGQNIDRVRIQLEDPWNLGTGGKIEFQASDKEEGTILWQSIGDAKQVDVGTNIDFIVSSGLPEKEMTQSFPLPIDRSIVTLKIEVDGEKVYEERLDTYMGYKTLTFSGKGTKTVSYYWDGVLQNTFELQFS